MTICSTFSPVIMDKLCVLLDKARPSTYILDLSFLSHSRLSSNYSPHFSLIIDSLLSNGFFLIINKCTVFTLPLKKNHPSVDFTSLPAVCHFSSPLYSKAQRKRHLYTGSLIPIYLFFLESLYISFCFCHSITTTSVNIIHDLKSSSY